MASVIYFLLIFSTMALSENVSSIEQPNLLTSFARDTPCDMCGKLNSSKNTENSLLENLHKIFSAASKIDDKQESEIDEELVPTSEGKEENAISPNVNHLDVKMYTLSPENITLPAMSLKSNNSIAVSNTTDQIKINQDIPWPVKKEAVVEGDLVLGGLMMVHEREDTITCGPIMPQGGIQALEAMLYTLDRVNSDNTSLLPNFTLGAHILDDCDKDTYGLEIAVDFIKDMS